ncbi:M48 family metalloprotease [Stenotrophomonas sp.]|uniref:M48 family metalloprotease n=1 Tax=Stenotrophomonas sp. TaxID=69392 RepID=UPI0028A03378|nr:M48 family metalloprotease [Stenotrophomonas sp.]
MSMNATQASAFAKEALALISSQFYAGDTPYACGLPMVPVVKTEPGSVPNGNLTPTDDEEGLGMVVSEGLLAIADNVAIKFALAHELGHGISEHVLSKVGLTGASGEATEVIADLNAAYLLNQLGIGWDTVIASISEWRTSQIFDTHKEGDHPPGDHRVKYVKQLRALIVRKVAFNDAARQICQALPDAGTSP